MVRYVGDIKKRIVHDKEAACPAVDKIGAVDKIPFRTVEDAEKARYRRCPVCITKLQPTEE